MAAATRALIAFVESDVVGATRVSSLDRLKKALLLKKDFMPALGIAPTALFLRALKSHVESLPFTPLSTLLAVRGTWWNESRAAVLYLDGLMVASSLFRSLLSRHATPG